jgi:hypothetical protein
MEDDQEVTLDQGLKIIDTKYVDKVIKYLQLSTFDAANDDYIKCYT